MPDNYNRPLVLIPLGPSGDRGAHPGPDQTNIHYVSRELYVEKFGAPYDDTREQKDVLLLQDTGNYVTKEQALKNTFVGKGIPEVEAEARRPEIFAQRATGLGLTSVIPPKDRERPDIGVLVNKGDGRFEAINPEEKGLTSLEEAAEQYGGENRIWLKKSGDSYIAIDQIRTYEKPNTAELQFAKYANIAPERNGADPEVFVQLNKDAFVSVAKYSEFAAQDPKLPTDTKGLSLLIKTQNNGLQTPGAAVFSKNYTQDQLDQILVRNGIDDPENVRTYKGVQKPEVLIKADAGILVSGEIARESLKAGQSLEQVYDKDSIYVQRQGKNNALTGNYQNLQTFERDRSSGNVQVRKENLGISERPAAAQKSRVNVEELSARFAGNLNIVDGTQNTRAEQNRPPANIIENDDFSAISRNLNANRSDGELSDNEFDNDHELDGDQVMTTQTQLEHRGQVAEIPDQIETRARDLGRV